MHYYTHHVGDYRKDTGHLSLLEHGIYRQMLDLYYLNESPLPADKAQCMRAVCVRTEDERQAFENVLKDFFYLTEKGYEHSGCNKRLDAIYAKSDKARENANKRWERERSKNMQTQCDGNANACNYDANATQNDADGMLPNTHNPIPITHNKTNSSNKFDAWWDVYPKKVEKKKALAIWKRRKLDGIADMLIEDAINRIKFDRKWIEGYIPNPSTYLNGDRWQDQIDATRGNNNGPHQGQSTSRSKRFSDELDEIARRDIEQNGFTDKLG